MLSGVLTQLEHHRLVVDEKDDAAARLFSADQHAHRFVFAMLKQPITAEFNDRMVIHVPDFKSLVPVWEKKQSFNDLVLSVMRELTKSNPQGHVHAQELYAAINLVRRVPPAPLFTLLETNPAFKHVGDLHFRLDEEA